MANDNFIPSPVRIKVIGAGGGGCNTLNRMVKAEIRNAEFIAVNTDVQALMQNRAPNRIQIGMEESRGLGVGGDPQRGRKCAIENMPDLEQAVSNCDILFIAAGMGGGTGTGSAPVIAKTAREKGALTIAIVTKPFQFELARRMQIAEEGIAELEQHVDAMIVLPNERLLQTAGDALTVDNAFQMVDDILMNAVRAISEVITVPGLVNLDFADVNAIMRNCGTCWLSMGEGSGTDRVMEAARSAVSSNLLEVPIEGATGVLYIVSGPSDLTLAEVHEAGVIIQNAVEEEATVFFGVTVDPSLGRDVRITLLATGLLSEKKMKSAQKAEEFRPIIKELEMDERKLDTPAFERRPISQRRISRQS